MPLSIFEHGDGRFRLFHDSREVGWVEGRVIGFSGFHSDAAAVRAATVAHDALNAWLARQSRAAVVRRRGRPLDVHWRDGVRQLTIDGISIGRLLAMPGTADSESRDSSAFELMLPPRIGAPLAAAQVVDQALLRHRMMVGLENAGAVTAPEAFVG
jgi:hypothetical protein